MVTFMRISYVEAASPLRAGRDRIVYASLALVALSMGTLSVCLVRS
jgi:hypothetical protein